MKHDPFDDLNRPAPQPSEEAVNAAWLSACCEFHRTCHKSAQTKHSKKIYKWIWPSAAVASIGILCAIIFTSPEPGDQKTTDIHNTTEIESLFLQGQQLFGDQLHAVSMTGNKITWHLHDSPTHKDAGSQLVSLIIRDDQHSNIHLTTRIGTPIDLQYRGQQHKLEFLPDESGGIIAYGTNIYWESDTPPSPIMQPKLQTISQ